MSKKPTAEAEPSNALLMRAITGLNAKFDKLPTVQHLEKKINDNNQALRTELMGEFEEKINAQAERVEQAISEIKTQIDKRPATLEQHNNGRNHVQQARYLRARRSIKVWPVKKHKDQSLEEAIREFFVNKMAVPVDTAKEVEIESVRPADQAKNSKIIAEVNVTFLEVEARDIIKSYANGLATSKGEAGLRLDCLKGSFKILNDHGLAMIRVYGRQVKRNIKFDDSNEDLMMDLKLPTTSNWYNITIEQTKEARKARERLDMQAIRRAAVAGPSTSAGMDRDQARALMLAVSPTRSGATAGNFTSNSGVVHINSEEDWRIFESSRANENENENEDTFESVEEILRSKK